MCKFEEIPTVSLSKYEKRANFGLAGDLLSGNGGIRHALVPLPSARGQGLVIEYKNGLAENAQELKDMGYKHTAIEGYTGELQAVIMGTEVIPLFDLTQKNPNLLQPLVQYEWLARRGVKLNHKVAKGITAHQLTLYSKLQWINEPPSKVNTPTRRFNAQWKNNPDMLAVTLRQLKKAYSGILTATSELLEKPGVGAVLVIPNSIGAIERFDKLDPSASSAAIVTA